MKKSHDPQKILRRLESAEAEVGLILKQVEDDFLQDNAVMAEEPPPTQPDSPLVPLDTMSDLNPSPKKPAVKKGTGDKKDTKDDKVKKDSKDKKGKEKPAGKAKPKATAKAKPKSAPKNKAKTSTPKKKKTEEDRTAH